MKNKLKQAFDGLVFGGFIGAIAFSLTLALTAEATPKYIMNARRVDTNTVLVSCTNGADPTGREVAYHVIAMSCTSFDPKNLK